MKNIVTLLVTLLLVSVTLAACAVPAQSPVGTTGETATPTELAPEIATPTIEAGSNLAGTLWTLDSYRNSEGKLVNVLPDTKTTLEFKEDKVGGNAGCNTYFASYKIDGNGLTIGVAGATRMLCRTPQNVMGQEKAYLTALHNAASYRMKGSKLDILNGDGETLLRFSALEPAPLTGTTWQLTGYNNGMGGFASVLRGTEITALFDAKGRLSGKAGCNNYSASYEINGEALSISAAVATRMACLRPDGIMKQERAYLSMLQSVAAYRIKGDSLELLDASGTRLALYTAQARTGTVSPLPSHAKGNS